MLKLIKWLTGHLLIWLVVGIIVYAVYILKVGLFDFTTWTAEMREDAATTWCAFGLLGSIIK